jgi:hypothetical protein
LILVNFLQECLGIVRGVVLDNLWRVAVVDLHNELCELASDGLVELLEKLKAAALWWVRGVGA